MFEKYPKILLIGLSFNDYSGSGITLKNLFKGWPKDKIAVTNFDARIDNFDVCENYYYLGKQERQVIFPFNIVKKFPSSAIIRANNTGSDIPQIKYQPLRIKTKFDFYKCAEFIGFKPVIYKTSLSRQFECWLDDFNPEIVFTHAGSYELINLALELKSKKGYKIAVHINDDYISTIYKNNLLSFYWKKKIERAFYELIKLSTYRMSISEFMSIEYKKRYGFDFTPFHNPVDVEFWNVGKEMIQTDKSHFEILYSGRVGIGISNSLIDVAEAVGLLNKKGVKVKLKIQTKFLEDPVCKKLANYPSVEFLDYIEYSKLPNRLASADILIMPYDFEDINYQYIKYSIPTKLTEYMISATPIVIYAPEETAISYYIKQHGGACTVNEKNPVKLAESIERILNDKKLSVSYGQKAKQNAIKEHNFNKVKKDFLTYLYNQGQ